MSTKQVSTWTHGGSSIMNQAVTAENMKGPLSSEPTETKTGGKDLLSWDLLELLISTCEDSLSGMRDKALLLFAFASGSCSRSILASVMVEDLLQIRGGYIYLPYSSTDHEGTGMYFLILGKAASALDAWLKAIGITEGKLFRGITRTGKITKSICSKTIGRIMRKRATLAGQDPSLFKLYSRQFVGKKHLSTEQLNKPYPRKEKALWAAG
jgi:integrase